MLNLIGKIIDVLNTEIVFVSNKKAFTIINVVKTVKTISWKECDALLSQLN